MPEIVHSLRMSPPSISVQGGQLKSFFPVFLYSGYHLFALIEFNGITTELSLLVIFDKVMTQINVVWPQLVKGGCTVH